MNTDSNDQGRLTTHVLDTANGTPAAGMQIDLYKIDQNNKELVLTINTNHDGRADKPLMEGSAFQEGYYELVFHVEIPEGFDNPVRARFQSAHSTRKSYISTIQFDNNKISKEKTQFIITR